MNSDSHDTGKTPAVHCSNVSVLRGDRYLLHDVDWQVPHRGVAAVIGPNGAGKSTLTKLLLGYLWPTRGQLTVDGRRFGETNIAELREVVQLVQPGGAVDIDGDVTTRDAIGTGFSGSLGVFHELTNSQEQAVDTMLARWGITYLASQCYGTLSTGERTRVQIARALISRPRVLVLDEPTAGLDVVASHRLLQTLETTLHQPDRPAVIVVTHHLEELPLQTADVLLLGDGRVIASGPPGDVLRDELLTEAYGTAVRAVREGERFRLQRL
jgi:iron complex transport system ATP-binding protein